MKKRDFTQDDYDVVDAVLKHPNGTKKDVCKILKTGNATLNNNLLKRENDALRNQLKVTDMFDIEEERKKRGLG